MDINIEEISLMDSSDYADVITALLIKRYTVRMRQIRARRKILQKYQQQKYLQYRQASERLFHTFSMKLFNFYDLFMKKSQENNCNRKINRIIVRELRPRRQNQIRSQHWWKIIFPNLTDDEFYYTFHVQREIYLELCEKLYSKLMPLKILNMPIEGTSVEKQIALCLYKLAHGSSYRKTSKIFGLHYTTCYKIFNKFLHEMINLNDISKLTYDECLEMNKNAINKVDFTQVIGTLVRVKFGSATQCISNVLGVVDVNEKFHFVHVLENTDDENFYIELNESCQKYYPNLEDDGLEHPMYLVVTDQVVPDYDCFLNKLLLKSNDKEQNDDTNDDCNKEKIELLQNINALLKYEENAVKKLVERWNTLINNLEFSSELLPLVIKSCIILHNLCEDYLCKNNIEYKSFDRSNIEFKKEVIDIVTDYEDEEDENIVDNDDGDYDNDFDLDNEENNINHHLDELKVIKTEILKNEDDDNDDDHNKNNDNDTKYITDNNYDDNVQEEKHNEHNDTQEAEIIENINENCVEFIHSDCTNDEKNEESNTNNANDSEELILDKFIVESIPNDTDFEDYDENDSVYFYGEDE